jgi:hypothetical protein
MSGVKIQTGVFEGANPFDVDPACDLPLPVQDGVLHYSETMFFIAINPDTGASVFVHLGRTPEELELWWAQTIAVLPDGRVVVDRSFGRSADPRGPATGNLSVRCTEPLQSWELDFDGAGEVTTAEAMAASVVGAGRAVPMSFSVKLRAAAPVCDFARILGADAFDWANAHQEQNLWSIGSLTVAGEVFDVTGVGFRDHSNGPRDFGKMGGDHFAFIGFPGSKRMIHALVAWSRDTEDVSIRMGGVYEAGKYEILDEVTMTGLIDPATAEPRELEMSMTRADQGPISLRGRVLSNFTITLGAPNINLNGALRGRDDVLSSLSIARYEWPDGEPGIGLVIRDYRPSRLPSAVMR